MIQLNNPRIYNLANAVRSARNPLNSWDRSDSDPVTDTLGPNDLDLARRLCRAGAEHRKFMRQIFVSVDIVAPLYWWKEADQYKVGTTTDSCSTMHTIHKRDLTMDDFSTDNLDPMDRWRIEKIIEWLNNDRYMYNNTHARSQWHGMIALLPSCYNQRRTWTGSYENLVNMYHQRKDHKLTEWRTFCEWVLTLPYMKEMINDERQTND